MGLRQGYAVCSGLRYLQDARPQLPSTCFTSHCRSPREQRVGRWAWRSRLRSLWLWISFLDHADSGRFQQMNRLAHLLKLISAPPVHGYEHPEVVENIFRKTLAYKPVEAWPEITGAKTVLDFGGGCGIHYKRAAVTEPNVRWAIVETPAMVEKARGLATDHLRFFADIDDACAWLGTVEVIHSDSAIQYTCDPVETVRNICAIGAEKMLWRRILLSDKPTTYAQRSLLAENGPGFRFTRKTMSVECSTISEVDFLHIHHRYRLIERGRDWFSFVREHA